MMKILSLLLCFAPVLAFATEIAEKGWEYERLDDDHVMIHNADQSRHEAAIDPETEGDVTVPSSLRNMLVVSIGEKAFYCCSNLTSVTIPEGVTNIAENAFYNCTSLTNVVFPASLKSIGAMAFCNCEKLASGNLTGASLTVETQAFQDCLSLSDLIFSGDSLSIGSRAFAGCSGLKCVSVWANSLVVGLYAFSEVTSRGTVCNSLTNLVLNVVNAEIGERAFESCERIERLIFSGRSISIGKMAFWNCQSFRKVSIDAETAELTEYAFQQCEKLSDAHFAVTNLTIGMSAFSSCGSLRNFHVESDSCTLGNSVFTWCTKLENAVFSSTVLSIGSNCFGGLTSGTACTSMTNLVLDSQIADIGSSAFVYCSSLDRLNFTISNLVVGTTAFSGCSGLTNVMVHAPGSLLVGQFAFSSCDSLNTVLLGSPVLDVGQSAFANLPLLRDVVLRGNGTAVLGQSVFSSCSALKGVMLPVALKTVATNSFYKCTSLTDISIPSNVTRISYRAFDTCTSLREIDFSEGLKTIDAQAFYGCESIESLDFPQSLESVGARAFEWCDGLTDIAFAEGDTNRVAAKRISIGERAFYNCLALEEVLLPQNLTAMGSRAFSQCDSLERINIPSNFTDIAESVFEDCAALATIEFPATLKSIGSTAFYGCANLTGFLIPTQNVVTIGAKAFKNTKYWNDYPSDLVVNNGYILGFKNNPVDVVLPDGCKSIPVAMFEGMTTLRTVTIPDSVTEIGSRAFNGCSGLTNLAFKSVTTIGNSAFEGCSSLAAVTLSEGLKAIPGNCFKDCISLGSVFIPDAVTSIGEYAFYNCASLVNVSGGAGVTQVGDYAFAQCPKMQPFEFPNDVAYGDHVFQGCTWTEHVLFPSVGTLRDEYPATYANITSIVFSTTLTIITNSACAGCASLAYIRIPEGVNSIGSLAFGGCSSLTSVVMSASVASVSSDAFSGCPAIESVVVSGTYSMQYLFPSSYANLTSIDFIDGVTSLCSNFMAGCSLVRNIAIPETVKTIGAFAFKDCRNVASFDMPTNVSAIANGVFAGCEGLMSFAVPDGVKSIGSRAFEGCSSLTSVAMPASVTSVAADAFAGCSAVVSATVTGSWPMSTLFPASYSNLTQIVLSDGVTSLCSGFMEDCSAIESFVLPSTVSSIGSSAFSNCGKLSSIDLPAGITAIESETFSECVSLRSVAIPDGVTSIGSQAFDGCTSLTELTMSASVTEVGSSAFRNCPNLSKLVVSGQFPVSSVLSDSGTTLKEIVLADDATVLCENLFAGCTSLTSVEIPWRVTEIGARAFYGCTGLTNVIVPEYVTTIDEGAFGRCTSLRSVDYLCEMPEFAATNIYAETRGDLLSRVLVQLTGWQTSTNSAGTTILPSGWCARPIVWWSSIQPELATIYFSYNTPWGGGTNLYYLADAEREILTLPGLPRHPFNTNLYCTGWYTDSSGGVKVEDGMLVGGSATYYAHWVENGEEEPESESYMVTWRANGGTVSPIFSVFANGTTVRTILGAAPTPKRSGLVFGGWYWDEDCVTPLNDPNFLDETVDENTSFYAKWTDGEDDEDDEDDEDEEDEEEDEESADIWFALSDEMATGEEIFDAAVEVVDAGLNPTIKVTGLPTGLKFTTKDIYEKGSKTEVAHEANSIYGTPTKSGVYTIVATVTTADKKTASSSQTVVVRKDGELVVKAESVLVDDAIETIASTEIPGKVTGLGVYAVGKKVTLRATANKGYVFAGWYDEFSSPVSRLASYSFLMPADDIALTAAFVKSEDDKASIDATVNGMTFSYSDDAPTVPEAIETNAYVGAYVEWPVAASALSATTVKVSGLPTGLRFAASPVVTKTTTGTGTARKTTVVTNVPANTIYGTPTVASKAGKNGVVAPSKIVITVTTAGRNTRQFTVSFTVLPLPTACVGTFTGYAIVQANTNAQPTAQDETGWIALPCPFTATVNAKGALSGSLTALGKKLSFKATTYASFDEDVSMLAYDVAIPLKTIDRTWTENMAASLVFAPGVASLGSRSGSSPHLALSSIDARRNAAKDSDYATRAKPYAGTYVATLDVPLPDGVTTGLVTVALTVDAKGGIKAAGTFIDATTFSASATLDVASDGASAEVLLPVTGKSFGSGGLLLAFGFEKDADGSIALVPLFDELGQPLSCAAKYVQKTAKAAASYAVYDLLENTAYAYRSGCWIGEALTKNDLLSISYLNGETLFETYYAFTSRSSAVTGLGRIVSGAKLSLRVNAKTGLFTGTNGKTKVFGALYPAEDADSTVSGCGSAVFATGAVSPLVITVIANP